MRVLVIGNLLPDSCFKKEAHVQQEAITREDGDFTPMSTVTWRELYNRTEIYHIVVNRVFYPSTLQQIFYCLTHGVDVTVFDTDGDVHYYPHLDNMPRNNTTVPKMWELAPEVYNSLKRIANECASEYYIRKEMADYNYANKQILAEIRMQYKDLQDSIIRECRHIRRTLERVNRCADYYREYLANYNRARNYGLSPMTYEEFVADKYNFPEVFPNPLDDIIPFARQWSRVYELDLGEMLMTAATNPVHIKKMRVPLHKGAQDGWCADASRTIHAAGRDIKVKSESVPDDGLGLKIWNVYGGSHHTFFNKARKEVVENASRPSYNKMFSRTPNDKSFDFSAVRQLLFYLANRIDPDFKGAYQDMPSIEEAMPWEYQS
jgi:hypothetical protein